MNRRASKKLKFAAVTVFLIGIIGTIVAAIYLTMNSSEQASLKAEIAKVLCHFATVGLLGGVLSFLVNDWEEKRQDDKELSLFRQSILDRIGDAYTSVRRCRRRLRAAGLTRETCAPSVTMTADQQKAYRENLEQVNEVELDIGKLRSEVRFFQGSFTNAQDLERELAVMGDYLLNLVEEYVSNSSKLYGGQELAPLGELPRLQGLIGPTCEGPFKEHYCNHYSEATNLIKTDLLHVRIQER